MKKEPVSQSAFFIPRTLIGALNDAKASGLTNNRNAQIMGDNNLILLNAGAEIHRFNHQDT